MKFKESPISGLFEVEGTPHVDERGLFVRLFCKREFAEIGFHEELVQINLSENTKKGTFRGFHYQVAPYQEVKLIRCVRGRVLDILVDLRANSPTFLQSVQIELSAANSKMVLVPKGLAHGFITLEENSSLLYHHTEFYNPAADRGVRFDDPKLKINLPLPIEAISPKDKNFELLPNSFVGV